MRNLFNGKRGPLGWRVFWYNRSIEKAGRIDRLQRELDRAYVTGLRQKGQRDGRA